MARQKLTLSIDRELIEPMKMLALVEKRELSEITEALYREYLERHRKFVKIIQRGKQQLET